LANKLEVTLRSRDSRDGLLLKGVEHVDCCAQLNRVGSTKRTVTALVLRSYLDDVTKVAFHARGIVGLLPVLSEIESVADVILNLFRHRP